MEFFSIEMSDVTGKSLAKLGLEQDMARQFKKDFFKDGIATFRTMWILHDRME